MIIAHIVGAKVWGGGEQYVYDVCKQFKLRGNTNYVFVDKQQHLLSTKYADVANVVEVNLFSMSGLGAYKEIRDKLCEYKVDILNCHSGHFSLLCALLKKNIKNIRFIMFRHNVQPNKYDSYHYWLRKQFDAVVCVSKLVYDLQLKKLEQNSTKKWHLVYSGIDISKFKEPVIKRKECFVVGYAGRLVENKGIDILLRAVANCLKQGKEIYLKIAGNGSKEYEDYIKNRLEQLNIKKNVELLGRQDDMNKFYRLLDVFVLPSLVPEAFGLALCEAMYCNIPVITTDSGAQKEIVVDGVNGFLVRAGSIVDLAHVIEKLYYDELLRNKIGEQGKITIENNFTIDKCVDNLESIYRTLL